MESITLAMYKSEGSLYLGSNKEGILCGYPSRKAALESMEKDYAERHARSYEASMSICIFDIFFAPRVVEVASLDDIRGDVIDMSTAAVHTCRNVAGSVTGVLCTGPGARRLYESGIPPNLIADISPKILV